MTGASRPHDPDAIRAVVREGYTRVARETDTARARAQSSRLGYSEDELDAVPDGAVLGVGCGNPTAIDSLRFGEVLVDLGSGAGFDALLAARRVGPHGHVIGVDMTDAMLEKARENARKAGADNVEFRKGHIEALPIEDASVDVIVSNCVINLSPEKPKVFAEAFRVLRPGGRLQISDLVLERALPQPILDTVDAYLGCVGGAALRADYLRTVEEAGFAEVRVVNEASFAAAIDLGDPQSAEIFGRLGLSLGEAKHYVDAVTSIHLFACKPTPRSSRCSASAAVTSPSIRPSRHPQKREEKHVSLILG